MLNIIIFGKPGSGKGTQASIIKDKYSLQHISTGDVFRKNMSSKTDLGLLAKGYMDKGELVPDQVTIDMLSHEIDNFLPCKGFIFDGFPRNLNQAKFLDKSLETSSLKLDFVIFFKIEYEVLEDRIKNRVKESSELRSDDNLETLKNRINIYKKSTLPILEHYRNKDIIHEVNAMDLVENVYDNILKIIE